MVLRELKRSVWPYKVHLNLKESDVSIIEIEEYLETLPKHTWTLVYFYNGTDFYFKEGKDATMFSLRWA